MKGISKVCGLLICLGLFHFNHLFGQITFQNPSFEGPSRAHNVPGPWGICFGTPDTQPGQWGITQAPSHGSSYISFLQAGASASGYNEGASQQLSSCLVAGTTYRFTIDFAFSSTYNTAAPGNCYGSLEILGGNGLCGQGQVLYRSGPVTTTTWQPLEIVFTPTSNWCYLTFHPYWITACSGYINGMIDNITPIVPANPNVHITSPTTNANRDCSFLVTGTTDSLPSSVVLTGNFIGSPVNATILTANTWQANISFPPNYNGTGNITATATFPTNTDTDTVSFNVVAPIANFTNTSVCLNQPTVFTDASTPPPGGNITGWQWDFGNGSTSSTQSPTHTYTSAGTFNVQLTVTSNDGCVGSVTKQVTVHPLPVASFTAPDVCRNSPTVFNDNSTISGGNITGWNWDFGDGSPVSNLPNPSHSYTGNGPYTATLTVTSALGCTGTTTRVINFNPLPVANFTQTSVCVSAATQFTNQSTVSTGSISTYNWSFGDGGSSGAASPMHAYSAPGNYNVKLVVTSNFGCQDSVTKPVVVYAMPTAGFTYVAACANTPVVFTDTSTVNNSSVVGWNWNFGDGGTSTQRNPSHIFTTSGTHNVTITTTTSNGCISSNTLPVTVYHLPVVDFTVSDACLNSGSLFMDLTTLAGGSITLWSWTFGDGQTSQQQNPLNIYTSPGTFNVQLTVITDRNCSGNVTKPAIVRDLPIADFVSQNVCSQTPINFNSTSLPVEGVLTNWFWDFGDFANVPAIPNSTSTLENPSFTYYSPGTFNVFLEVTNSFGCKNDITKQITVFPNPVADFSFDVVCFGTPTTFTDGTIIIGDVIQTYSWDFGDNSTSAIQEPAHNFVAGVYDVVLNVITSNGCTSSVTYPVRVHPMPVAQYTHRDSCFNVPTVFVNQSTLTGDNYQTTIWDFGDGTTSGLFNPTYTYPIPGIYQVVLTATSDSGCVNSITHPVEIFPLPVAAFTPSVVEGCMPLPVDFYNQSNIGAGYVINRWDWDLGDGVKEILQSPSHVYQNPGTYSIFMRVTSANGCMDSIFVQNMILVHPLPVAGFTVTPPSASILDPIFYFVNSARGAVDGIWNLGDQTTQGYAYKFSHVYPDTGIYEIEQIVYTQYGCTDTLLQYIYVKPDLRIYIPNAFTPNGDEVNDTFGASGIGIEQYSMKIYDRWGMNIFNSKDMNNMWDGKVSGSNEVSKQDVYIYSIDVVDIHGEKYSFKGHVTLVK